MAARGRFAGGRVGDSGGLRSQCKWSNAVGRVRMLQVAGSADIRTDLLTGARKHVEFLLGQVIGITGG